MTMTRAMCDNYTRVATTYDGSWVDALAEGELSGLPPEAFVEAGQVLYATALVGAAR